MCDATSAIGCIRKKYIPSMYFNHFFLLFSFSCFFFFFFSFYIHAAHLPTVLQPHMLRGCKEQSTPQAARAEDVFAQINSRPWSVPSQENRGAGGGRDSPKQALLTRENAADFT